MKRAGSLSGLAVCLQTLLIIPATHADLANAPWPMYRHDLKHTAEGRFRSSKAAGLKWSYHTGFYDLCSPAVTLDSAILIGSLDNNLYCLSSAGTLAWSWQTGHGVEFGGAYSSPALDVDGKIFFGGLDNYFYALNSTGSLSWSYLAGPAIGYESPIIPSPSLISMERVYCGTEDGNLYAWSVAGALLWSYKTDDLVRSSAGISDDGSLYFGSTDNVLRAVNSSGTLRWSYVTGNDVRSSPAINTAGNIFVGSYDARLYSFNSVGTKLWSYTAGDQVKSCPGIGSNGRVYFGDYIGDFYSVESTGAIAWSYKLGTLEVYSSPAIDSEENVLIGCNDNVLYSFNSNGTLLWSYRAGATVESSPSIGSDGTVYVGSDDSTIYAIYQATPTPIGDPLYYHSLSTDQTGEDESRVVSSMTDFEGVTHNLLTAGGILAPVNLHAERAVMGASLFLDGFQTTSINADMWVGANWCVLATGGAGGITITLPAATYKGKIAFIKKVDSGTGVVTVTRAGSDTIEGATSVLLASRYSSVLLVADGTNTWYIITVR